MIDHGKSVLQATSLKAKQRILRVQARNLLVAGAEDLDRLLDHGNTVHGSPGSDEEVNK